VTARPILVRRTLVLAVVGLAGVTLGGCTLVDSVLGTQPEGEADVFSIVVGDCLNDAEVEDEVTTVARVECSEPHDSEVFARTETTGDTFPGNPALETELADFCRGDVFTEFIGVPYADSAYDTSGYFPSTSSWGSGDRELLCTVWDPEGRVTGSLEGAESDAG
jgi:hypothetical protein